MHFIINPDFLINTSIAEELTNMNSFLVIYIPKNDNALLQFEKLTNALKPYADESCQILIYEGILGTEEQLLYHITGYITGRSPQNLNCSESAYVLGVPCYSGFSKPIF